MSNTVYLSLGSNVGDGIANLREAIRRISEAGTIGTISSFYETEPVEFTDQAWFVNCVLELKTSHSPQELIIFLLAIEQAMGRHRDLPKGPRNIDIDILLFGSEVVDVPGLTIPHPAMAQRRFVLVPLAEIAPDAIHPVFMRSARALHDELPESAGLVRRLSVMPQKSAETR